MKFEIHLLFLFALLFSCSSEKSSVKYYGLVDLRNTSRIVKIDPIEFNTFDEFVDRVDQVRCNDSIPVVGILDDTKEILIGLANPCWGNSGCIHIKRRNVLKIKDEKIKLNNDVSIDSLEYYISRHYNNRGDSFVFSQSPQKAIISISYEQKDISGLRTIIQDIYKYHSALNLEWPLYLSLDKQIPSPAPIVNFEG